MARVLTEKATGRSKGRIDGVGKYSWEESGGGAALAGPLVTLISEAGTAKGIIAKTGDLAEPNTAALTLGAGGGAGTLRAILAANDVRLNGASVVRLSAGGLEPGSVELIAGLVQVQPDPAKLISEYGAAGAPQCPHIPAATDEASAVSGFNLLRAYFLARGTMAAV